VFRGSGVDPVKAADHRMLREDLDVPRSSGTPRAVLQPVDEHGVTNVPYSTVSDYMPKRRPEAGHHPRPIVRSPPRRSANKLCYVGFSPASRGSKRCRSSSSRRTCDQPAVTGLLATCAWSSRRHCAESAIAGREDAHC